jgi:HAD superfamily hydrolase (TIGR02253 family)
MKIKAVIFDLDNTLVNFTQVKHQAVEAAVDAMIDAGLKAGKEETVKRVFKIYEREGIEDQQIFDKMLVEDFGHIDYRILAAGITGYRRAKAGSMALYPHVRITLTQLLKMGIKLAIVSDAPRLLAWLRLVSMGLDPFFDVVVAFEDTGKRKPDPAPFQLALSRLGVESKDALMIGDWAVRDMVGAKAVGMVTVFARYGDDFNTQVSGADHDITDVIQLLDIVKKINE